MLWRLSRRRLAHRAGLRLATRDRACGLAVLRAPAVASLSARTVPMPPRPGLHRRAVVLAGLRVDDVDLVVASTHLDLEPAARLDSAHRVRAALPDGPVVLAGDVNEQPGGPVWDVLGAGLVDARDGLGPTFPSRGPDRRLDGLWVRGLQVRSARVVTEAGRASDHLPLCVDLV